MKSARTLIVAMNLLALSCRGGKDEGDGVPSPAPVASAPGAAPVARDASVPTPPEEGAVAPVAVSGAFLLSCSADTRTSFVREQDRADDLVACVVTDAENRPQDLGIDAVTITFADGRSVPGERVTKETTAPWQFGFRGASGETDARLKVDAHTTSGAALVLAAEELGFSWQNHPRFADFVAFLETTVKLIDTRIGFSDKPDSDPTGHLVFVTDAYVRGDFGGIAAADAMCAAEGALVPYRGGKATYKAVLSTSSSDARDRLSIKGRVYDFGGRVSNPTADEFWQARHDSGVRYTSTGRVIGSATWDDAAALPVFLASIWLATTVDGRFDQAAGDCAGWTTRSSSEQGGAGILRNDETPPTPAEPWLSLVPRACSMLGRILCLSQ